MLGPMCECGHYARVHNPLPKDGYYCRACACDSRKVKAGPRFPAKDLTAQVKP